MIHQHKNKTIVVMDGRKTVAVARYNHIHRHYLLKAYGFCWTDPAAREPNVFGIVNPELMLVKRKGDVMKQLNQFNQ